MFASPIPRAPCAMMLALGLVFALGIGAADAQQQPSPAAIATAKEVITAKGATALYSPLVSGVIERTKSVFLQTNPMLSKDLNEVAAKLHSEYGARSAELVNEVAKLYASRFTEQELKDTLAFYKSPLGRKLIVEEPAVRDESVAVLGAAQQGRPGAADGGGRGLDRPPRRAQSERHHFDRQREAAERRHPLRFIGNDDHAGGGRGDDLFPQQRAASALDQAQIVRDLVGTIDGEIELRRLVEAGERHAQPFGVAARPFRRGHRDHVEASADALGQKLDKMLGGRAAAKAKPHAGAHEFEGAGGGGTFLGIDIHRDRNNWPGIGARTASI